MADFRRTRRQRPGAGGPGGTTPPPPASGPAEALRNELAEIAESAASPEEALEPALQAILRATGSQVGALCLYNDRQGILRLAAEQGLSEEGCKRLRSVRRGDPAGWDMPLHGLLNRRAYLIESAAQNRYVPPLVEHPASVRTVACVPVYAGPTPVASVVLIALAPRSLSEREVRLLDRPVADLANLIVAARRHAGAAEAEPEALPSRLGFPDVAAVVAERDRLRADTASRLAERARLAAELASRSGESDRLRDALEAASAERTRLLAELDRARADAERVETLAAALAAAEDERARLASGLEAAAAERAGHARAEIGLERARAEAERAAAAAAAEVEAIRRAAAASDVASAARIAQLVAESEHIRARLAEAEAAVGQERSRADEREREHERLAVDLRSAAAREQHVREELASALTQATTADEEALQHALEAARAAEEAREVAVAEAETVRRTLDTAEATIEALEDEASRAHADVERLEAAERSMRAEHEGIVAALAVSRGQDASAAAQLADAARELGVLRTDRDRLAESSRQQQAERLTLVARLEAVAAERDRVRDALGTLGAERDRLASESTSSSGTIARLEEALARERAERAQLAEALTSARAALAGLESAQAEREAQAAASVAELETLRAEHARLRVEPPPVEHAPPPEQAGSAEPVRVITVVPPRTERPRVRTAQPGQRVVAIVDTEPQWEDVGCHGHELAVLEPNDGIGAQIAELAPTRILVNLAAPGALAAVAAIRAAGSKARVWACLADPLGDRALALGMIEPTTRPLDPDAILELIASYTIRGTRVITAGNDVDALMSLRQALARRGLSVSMAWDGKQAVDLFAVVRPELLVVDLNLPRRDGYSIVAQLGKVDPMPTCFIVPGTDDATNFAAVLADPAHVARHVALDRLLANVVARSEAPPVEKRQKMRAIGRK